MIRQKKSVYSAKFFGKNALLLLKMIDVVWLSVISQEYFFSLSICKWKSTKKIDNDTGCKENILLKEK